MVTLSKLLRRRFIIGHASLYWLSYFPTQALLLLLRMYARDGLFSAAEYDFSTHMGVYDYFYALITHGWKMRLFIRTL